MSDLTLPIIGLTTLAGYFFSQNGRNPRQRREERKQIDTLEKPNGDNIYESKQFETVNTEMLNRSFKNYRDAEDPASTGVLPPLFNIYSAVGSDQIISPMTHGQVSKLSSEQQAEITRINRTVDVTQSQKSPAIDDRPMFNQSFAVVGKEHEDVGAELRVTNNQVSLLTGLPIDTSHNNMVPFFGSNVRQNVEKFTNESIMENMTGKKPTFQHKKEIAPMFSKAQQDIYGTPTLTENIDTDRYIPSLYRQNEKPFDDQKIQKPIAWTIDNDVQPWKQFKTVDDLRVASKPKSTYEGVVVPGQQGEVRGVMGEFHKRRPDTFYEQTPDHLLKTTGQFLAPQAQQDFVTNLKDTARKSYNVSYFGNAATSELQRSRQTVSLDGQDQQASLVQESKRINFENDYGRNAVGNRAVHDYGRSGMKSYETERHTTGQETHLLNANRSATGLAVKSVDLPKTTLKETALSFDNSGHVKTAFDHGAVNAYYTGISGISAKTTHKETTLMNNYKGIMNKEDGMGYLVNKYEAKTTGKEIISSNSEHTGNAGGGSVMKNAKVYSTYDSPEKVRNAVHAVDYRGNANLNSESSSRDKYHNAHIREQKEATLLGERPSGPQKFQLASGKDVVGDIKTSDNLLLKEQETSRENMNGTLPQILRGKDSIGYQSKIRYDDESVDTVFADRLQPDLVISQHNQNPFSLKKHL
uniref:Uncharacterized protein n=1 Tax=viral metagenome TaxID=1070528 RepID=A0A6C0H747_9ZZZZ